MSATAHSAAPALVRRPFRALRFTRDEELVRMLRAGDERAFEALYDRHHRGILAFCRHMLGSAEEAEDAVQHTFIAAHRDLTTSDKPIQLKAWLYTIARNRCLSVLRARKEERALDDVAEPSVQGLAAEVQQRQDLRDLLADLQRLPEEQRAALVLSELGALSHEEIGATLGVRKDKVKALVFQARESLASSRSAREADCREIQEQLAVLRGGSLRRTTLRRHVEVCPACAAFKAEVKRQRGAMAAILPVVPSLALKETVLAAIFGGGAGGGGIIGGGLLAATGGKALVAKVATVAVVAGGATGGGLVAVDEISNGGDGNTATAMAGVPEERRSVRMVDALRERAERTAAARDADRDAGGGTVPASTAPGSGGADGARGERRRTTRTRAERGAVVRTAGARAESFPVAIGTEEPQPGETGKPDKAPRVDKPAKDNASGKDVARSDAGARRTTATRRRGPGIDPKPPLGRDGERGHRVKELPQRVERAIRRRPRKPAKAPAPAPVPEAVAPPTEPQQPGRDDRERGHGRPEDPGHTAKKAYDAATGALTAVTDAVTGADDGETLLP